MNMQTIVRKIAFKYRSLGYTVRGALLRYSLFVRGCRNVGKNLRVGRSVNVLLHPFANLRIGDNVFIGDGARIELLNGAEIEIDSFVKLTANNWIVAAYGIRIGRNSLFGEFASIRDHDHGTARGNLISSQELYGAEVNIGRDCWVARNALILKGVNLADGSILGAYSFANRSTEPYSINVGIPSNKIGCRE